MPQSLPPVAAGPSPGAPLFYQGSREDLRGVMLRAFVDDRATTGPERTKAVRMSLLHHDARSGALAQLPCFRGGFYSYLTTRSDALFELADAVLCSDGSVRSVAELSMVGELRRGHGALYAAIARGRNDANRLRRALAEVPLPRAADGQLVLAIDVICWLRPDAHTSPPRILCHTYGRGKDQHIPVPG
ncbi:transposase [Streptomyces bobili]|uniref:transposase n=1 Tax=Streptomyces bobili TaxID=67280 RepID=UPI0036EAAFEE